MIPFLDILDALNHAGVRYVVVGGMAVVLRGVVRLTQDVDVVLSMDAANLDAALGALEQLGLRPMAPVALREFADPSKRLEWQKEKNMVVLSLLHPAKPLISVDLFLESPIDFETLYSDADEFSVGSAATRVASVAHLIQMKRLSGRPQDVADIHALESLYEQ